MIGDEEEARRFVARRTDADGMARIERFCAMLAEENTRQNLVARPSMAHLWQRHIADSAQLLDHVPHGTSALLDLGSGAGFPGLVLSLLRPMMPVTLVESRRKRIDWLFHVKHKLQLDSISIKGARLETLETQHFDVISARAFAPLEKLIGLAARFATANTRWLLPKGRSARDELAGLPPKMRQLFHVEPSLTDPEAGIVLGTGVPTVRGST